MPYLQVVSASPGPECPRCQAPGREAARRFTLTHDDGAASRATIHIWLVCDACGVAWERDVRRAWSDVHGRAWAHPGEGRAKAERVGRRLARRYFDYPAGAFAGQPAAFERAAARFVAALGRHNLGAVAEPVAASLVERARLRLVRHYDGRINFKYSNVRRRLAAPGGGDGA